jgi:hypothetical protein
MMMTGSSRTLRFLALLVGSALVSVTGCGDDDGLGKRYPVSGKVTYNGQPVPKAKLSFVPVAGDGRGAYGDVENGAFTLTTLSPNDGALPGDYKVTLDTRQIDEAKLKDEALKLAKKQGMENFSGGAMVPQELRGKALQNAKQQIPGKYQLPDTSDIKLTVEPKSNSFAIELKD